MVNTGDTAFMIICAALVCLMTPGLAFFYGGLVSRKNVLTIMMQSFISMGVVTILWFFIGFSLTFGPDIHGIIGGLKYVCLNGVGMDANPDYGETIPFLSFFSYQQMFAILTPALITGAFADRVNFKSYLVFLIFWSILIYIPLAHWVWGGGFLQQLGVVDFAGGIVVHASAGLAALASVFFVGKRNIDSTADTEPHNVTHVALGTALLWFGWFGFNAGGALGANALASTAFINTDIAASTAMVTWLVISWVREKTPSFVGVLTGAAAGRENKGIPAVLPHRLTARCARLCRSQEAWQNTCFYAFNASCSPAKSRSVVDQLVANRTTVWVSSYFSQKPKATFSFIFSIRSLSRMINC